MCHRKTRISQACLKCVGEDYWFLERNLRRTILRRCCFQTATSILTYIYPSLIVLRVPHYPYLFHTSLNASGFYLVGVAGEECCRSFRGGSQIAVTASHTPRTRAMVLRPMPFSQNKSFFGGGCVEGESR